jgi:hypothetical protein
LFCLSPPVSLSREFTLAFFCSLLARVCTFLFFGSPGLGVSCMRMLEIYGVGLAVATIAYASQSSLLTHRDSPIAVILFATTSILLFTLPRVGGDSRIPHVVALLFGFTTILGYLFGTSSIRSIPPQLSLCSREVMLIARCRPGRLRIRIADRKTSTVPKSSAFMQKSRYNMVARPFPLVPPSPRGITGVDLLLVSGS